MKRKNNGAQRLYSLIWINILLYPFGYEVSGVSYDMNNGKRGKRTIHIGRNEMYKNNPVIKLFHRWANKHLK